jgi:hypothetical protein
VQESIDLCIGCEVADLISRRHGLGDMSRGEIIARLGLAFAIQPEGMPFRLGGAVIDDMIDLARPRGGWSR